MINDAFIGVHTIFGILSLFSGVWAMLCLKGSQKHILAGKVYYFSILLMALAAIFAAILNARYSNLHLPILIIYLAITGKDTFQYTPNYWNLALAGINLLNGLLMLFLGMQVLYFLVIEAFSISFFAVIALTFSIIDYKQWKNRYTSVQTIHSLRMVFSFMLLLSGFFINQLAEKIPPLFFFLSSISPFLIGFLVWVLWNKNKLLTKIFNT